jgi:hypothetical protein
MTIETITENMLPNSMRELWRAIPRGSSVVTITKTTNDDHPFVRYHIKVEGGTYTLKQLSYFDKFCDSFCYHEGSLMFAKAVREEEK